MEVQKNYKMLKLKMLQKDYKILSIILFKLQNIIIYNENILFYSINQSMKLLNEIIKKFNEIYNKNIIELFSLNININDNEDNPIFILNKRKSNDELDELAKFTDIDKITELDLDELDQTDEYDNDNDNDNLTELFNKSLNNNIVEETNYNNLNFNIDINHLTQEVENDFKIKR